MGARRMRQIWAWFGKRLPFLNRREVGRRMAGVKTIPIKIDFVTPSDEAICLHEAGHTYAALVVGLYPVLVEFVHLEGSPGLARNSIPVGDDGQRRLVACAAYAVEYKLFRAGRLTDASGAVLDEKTFIHYAIGGNAALDKVKFFGEDREQANGCWPAADDRAFMDAGAGLARHLSMDCVFAIAEAMLNERRLERDRIIEIAAPFLQPQ
ncbi:hypothetical protein ACU4GH_40390 (plasmid) [Bradyrhizobium betae]